MRRFLCFISITLIFFSCYNNAFNEAVFRTTKDPFDDIPTTDSVTDMHTVFLSWNSDDGADKFYLMKSFDASPLNWNCIYEGNKTFFIDEKLPSNSQYIYRLDKSRGEKYFKGKHYAYGWSSECMRDFCESNDNPQDATFLEYDHICNLTCAGFETNKKEILDEDWFYVIIPPMRQADIVVSQHNLENTTLGAKTNLRIQLLGLESQAIKHKVSYPIKNASYETKTFYFKVFPERTSLSSGNKFCTVIEYTVSLNQIIKY